MASCDNLLHHFAAHVGQAEVAAVVAIGEFLVIHAQQVEDGGVEVVDVAFVDGGFVTDLVGLAIATPPFTPPPAIQ